jgi:hypothetical protein
MPKSLQAKINGIHRKAVYAEIRTLQKNKGLTTLFTTGSALSDETYDLLLEYGPDYCTYGYWSKDRNSFAAIKYLSFQPLEDGVAVEDIVNDIKDKSFNRVIFSSGYHTALLLPDRFKNKGEELLRAVYNERNWSYLQDAVPQWQLQVGYSLPAGVYHSFANAFPSPRYMHAYTAAIKAWYLAPNCMDLCFSPAHFRILLKKEGRIQLAQTYSYANPLDVIYILLKISYEFGLDQKEVEVTVSGLIDKSSTLYKEVYSYFLNLDFAHQSFALPGDEYPQHYFASLYNMAVCAS